MSASFSSLDLVFLGPPGSGAEVQASELARRYSIAHISADEALREEAGCGTSLGNQIESLLERSRPVPARLLAGIILRRLHGPDCARGFLLEGFPANLEEALLLDEVMAELGRSLERVMLFNLRDEEILSRLRNTGANDEGRGRSWPVGFGPLCSEENRRGRLEVYRRQMAPVIELYRRRGVLVEVDASLAAEAISEAVIKTVGAPVGA